MGEQQRVDNLDAQKSALQGLSDSVLGVSFHQLHDSSYGLQYKTNLKRSCEGFVGLGVTNTIPAATAVIISRMRLKQSRVIEILLEMLKARHLARAFQADDEQTIDTTLVPVAM